MFFMSDLQGLEKYLICKIIARNSFAPMGQESDFLVLNVTNLKPLRGYKNNE
jgi:hypothetical protein